MSDPVRCCRSSGLWRGVGAGILAVVLPLSDVLAGNVPEAAREGPIVEAPAVGALTFPAPKRFAIVQFEPDGHRRLFASGELVFDPQSTARFVVIEEVGIGGIVVRDHQNGPGRRLPAGSPNSTIGGGRLLGTVLLDELRFRYREVGRIIHDTPFVVSITGTQAILEKEVLGQPAPAQGRSHAANGPSGDFGNRRKLNL